jgi:putative NADH-flavin reductase
MRIAVFGSTGGNGRLILREAVARGHAVTAFARRPDALADCTGLAAVVQGDARDPGAVARAVAGQDAVISTVSSPGTRDGVTQMLRTVIAAMDEQGVQRLVSVSAYGIVAQKPRVAAPLVRFLLRRMFADQRAADGLIVASELDWTILRATRLTGRPAPGAARVQTAPLEHGPWSLSRSAFATVLVDHVEQARHVREIANVSG